MSKKDWKKNAAEKAAKLVEDDMTVGLGSGSTLAEVVKTLGEKKSEAEFVCASTSTLQLADRMDLNLTSLKKNTELDITIDGADEVNPEFDMIKGGGGAHAREKIVANAARKVAIVVDKTKFVEKLGEKNPVPNEIIPFSHEHVSGLIESLGSETQLRKSTSGGPFVTDNGNYIIDADFGTIDNPAELGNKLNQVPGVIENGIFIDLLDRLFVGHENGCETAENKEEFLKILKEI